MKIKSKMGILLCSSQMLSVSKDSQCLEETTKFISWFPNSTECNEILNGERGIPINSAVREALSKNLSEA